MPHFQIDYSGNLEGDANVAGLCEAIRAEAALIETFPLAGIRVRAVRVDHYAIADGQDHHAFIDISVRLRAGRSEEVKQDAVKRIFETAQCFLEPVLKRRSLALSLEMRDIDPELSPKTGTIRKHLEEQK